MEGVMDAPMRSFLTQSKAFDFCVSEFVRVSREVVPAKVYKRLVPEAIHNCKTASEIPVQIQILGGDPDRMGESALVAHRIGAPAIDINFGCPAPTVNRHDGGATLLKYPARIHEIVQNVRSRVPQEIPVSAKMRLGWENIDDVHKNADAAARGGASWVTIHARTKVAGYRPPVFWQKIGEVSRELPIPVVANGDIWSIDDFRKCRDLSQTNSFMLGRGALRNPALPLLIRKELSGVPERLPPLWNRMIEKGQRLDIIDWILLLSQYAQEVNRFEIRTHYLCIRLKQWARMAEVDWFDEIKMVKEPTDFFSVLIRLAGAPAETKHVESSLLESLVLAQRPRTTPERHSLDPLRA